MKENRKFYFSVEGDTEIWYLEWLQKTINGIEESKYNVKFDSKKQKNPMTRAKGINIIRPVEINHIFDIESEDPSHTKQVKNILDNMKKAENIGKSIKYFSGYSNFTFELWIILHKADCCGSKAHRDNYLTALNQAYNKKFMSLKEYKKEANFKSLLDSIEINDVISAIERAKRIMDNNEKNCNTVKEFSGYQIYIENPSLTIWQVIEKILKECKLYKSTLNMSNTKSS